MHDERTVIVHNTAELIGLPTRRNFLKALGLGGTLVLMPSVFAACTDNTGDLIPPTSTTSSSAQTISLGSDVGIFTFAYVLEQLESSFYSQLVALSSFGTLFNANEQEMLTDIRNDEVTHREFLRTALGGSFPNLSFNFTSLGSTPTALQLLTAGLTLETNGIAAYNGAGYLLKNANNLLMAGKIVSIEARHTSALADAIDTRASTPSGTLYADLTQPLPASLGAQNGPALDAAATAATVAANAQPFIVNPITLTA